jgi:hypothetical protein
MGYLRCRIHASPVETVSLKISEAAGAVRAVESMRHPWKHFRWWFRRPEGLFALSNPCLTIGSSFVDDFWFCSESVFVDDFIAHMGSLRCPIHA